MGCRVKREARVELDIGAEVLELMLQTGALVERGAELIAEEIRESIPDSDFPAQPGQPPHSPGPYRDSWKHTGARRRGNSMVAWAFSMSSVESGESLAEILEEGRGPVEPHPHISSAVELADRLLDAEVARMNAAMRGGA